MTPVQPASTPRLPDDASDTVKLACDLIARPSVTPNDAGCQAVIRRELKKRDDSVESFEKGGRPELAEKERAEAEILKRYLPAELPEEEVVTIIDTVIAELGASCRKDMGPVMKAVQEKTAGAVDNKKLSGLVMSKLG